MTTLGDLKPDKNNARKHNPRNIGMIADSISKVGLARSIVVDEDLNILAGNGTVEAAGERGLEKVRIIEADGNELIAVQRKGLTDKQKKQLALADNRTAETAEWDIPVLKEINIEMPGLLEDMFMPLELDELLDLSEDTGFQEGEDDAPEPPEEPVTKMGDIYQLGEHRLMCGDSTDKETVGILMDGQKVDMVFTDPPYGVDYEGINNDSREGLENLLNGAFSNISINSKNGASVYVFHSDRCADIYHSTFRKYFHFSSMLIWVKNSLTLSQTDYQSRHEPCLYGWNDNGVHQFFGDRTHTSIIEIDRPSRSDNHPTMKPVGFIEKALINSSLKNKTIYDPFGGSGSTLIACEKLDRKCYMMEIDPAYCDVIVKRWEDFTGKKAELIKELVNG